MHELGVVIEVVKTVERFAKANNVSKIDKLVLQIGELSSMIPKYIESCYPAAVDGTIMEETKLEIEILPGNAICKECNSIFNFIQSKGKCSKCGSNDIELISGKEFMIKEILAC
ncbi:MAG: hydrogenase maturation nickel metallochaperone HypA [Salinivirgaceae bacterium]|nr:hydrogenase maturation nickel metallochaperone HypA [Salinivirgaceae bacterium]